MRELSNVEKQENVRLQKQLESQKSEISSFTKDREKLQKDVGQLEAEVIELKEMVCRSGLSFYFYGVARWLSGRASDLRSRSHGFEARP